MRVKICGIRSASDLATALAAGADAVGFLSGLTHRSEDVLEPDSVRELAASVPESVASVLVTHLTDPDAIVRLARRCSVTAVQMHGEYASVGEEAAAVRGVCRTWDRGPVVRAVHVPGPGDADAVTAAVLRQVTAVAAHVDAVLLDSRTGDRLGGTGRTHDWSVSARIRARAARLERPLPVILAGGLTPENLRGAVARVRPAGVDVNSGVRDARGCKDATRVRRFVRAAAGEGGARAGAGGTGAPDPAWSPAWSWTARR